MDLAAEKAVLGSMMIAPGIIGSLIGEVAETDFFNLVNAWLFGFLRDRYTSQRPIDELSVAAALAETPGPAGQRSALTWVGGVVYLHELVSCVPVAANAPYYAGIVAHKAVLRRVVAVGARITQLGHAPAENTDDLVSQVIAEAETLRSNAYVHAVSSRAAVDLAIEAMSTGADRIGTTTGFLDLDALTGCFAVGELVVIAGRPGAGKSVLASDFARTFAGQGERVLYVSLEMSTAEVMLRNISAVSRIPHDRLRNNALESWDYDRFNAAVEQIANLPLDVWDKPDVGVAEFRSEILRYPVEDRPRVLVVDYIQLGKMDRRLESRQAQVADFTRGLKLLAKQARVLVIAVAQLNRLSEMRNDKRPQLSDLRESGAIEQDADKVLLVHRPEMYDPNDRKGEADLIAAKCRNGPTGTVPVAAQLHLMHFADMAVPC
jgi:replicative DNA helicase